MSNIETLDICSLIDTPIDQTTFQVFGKKSYPLICAGILMRSRFDQARISLNKKYKPFDVFHLNYNKGNINFLCLRAIPLTFNKTFQPLVNQLVQTPHINLSQYKNLIAEFNLTCDECYGYYNPTVFPIDAVHIKTLTKKFDKTDLYSKVLNIKIDPQWFGFGSFTLFILTADPFITEKARKNFCADSDIPFVE